jgi:hypothetical protein
LSADALTLVARRERCEAEAAAIGPTEPLILRMDDGQVIGPITMPEIYTSVLPEIRRTAAQAIADLVLKSGMAM